MQNSLSGNGGWRIFCSIIRVELHVSLTLWRRYSSIFLERLKLKRSCNRSHIEVELSFKRCYTYQQVFLSACSAWEFVTDNKISAFTDRNLDRYSCSNEIWLRQSDSSIIRRYIVELRLSVAWSLHIDQSLNIFEMSICTISNSSHHNKSQTIAIDTVYLKYRYI